MLGRGACVYHQQDDTPPWRRGHTSRDLGDGVSTLHFELLPNSSFRINKQTPPMTWIIGNFQVSRAARWCKFYDVKARDGRVDSTLDSELIKFGRNLRAATCPGSRSNPLPCTEAGDGEREPLTVEVTSAARGPVHQAGVRRCVFPTRQAVRTV